MTEQVGSTLGSAREVYSLEDDGDLAVHVPGNSLNPAQFSPRAVEEAMNRPYPNTFVSESAFSRFMHPRFLSQSVFRQ